MDSTKPANESNALFFAKNVAAASIAASIAEAFTIPFDTAKVIKQVEANSADGAASKYNGLIGTLRTVAAEEGPLTLFNGLTAGI